MNYGVSYLQLLPRDVLHNELAPLLSFNNKDDVNRKTYRSTICIYKVLAFLLLLLCTALLYWIIYVYWPRVHIPCIPYNCTWAPYNDQGRENASEWCDSRGCVWGVNIGYGQGGWQWGQFDGSPNLIISIDPPHPNPTTCYHPPPINPDSWDYCYDANGTPNWINGYDCLPVLECTPEVFVGMGLQAFIITCPIVTAILYALIFFFTFSKGDYKENLKACFK